MGDGSEKTIRGRQTHGCGAPDAGGCRAIAALVAALVLLFAWRAPLRVLGTTAPRFWGWQ